MEHERKLLSKALHTGSVESVIARGIETRHFSDPKLRAVWDSVCAHVLKYGSSPSAVSVLRKHSDVVLDVVQDSLEYVIDQFLLLTKRRIAVERLLAMGSVIDGNDDEQLMRIEEIFLESAQELSRAVPGGKVARYSDMNDRIRLYEHDAKEGASRGIQFGIPTLDDLTYGIQPHELVVISGWQGTGKSTLMQHILHRAYVNEGATPMLISLEMEASALYRKWDTMAAPWTYDELKGHRLSDDQLVEWGRMAERAKKASNDIIVLDDVGRCTVEKVHAEMNRYNPDIVGIDYISLMSTPKDDKAAIWETVTYITKELKQLARSTGTPIVAIAQTNRESATAGARLENISYSRSIGQDSDIVLGLYSDEVMREEKRMQVRMLKNRDGRTTNIDMKWDMDQMRFREWSVTDEFGTIDKETT